MKTLPSLMLADFCQRVGKRNVITLLKFLGIMMAHHFPRRPGTRLFNHRADDRHAVYADAVALHVYPVFLCPVDGRPVEPAYSTFTTTGVAGPCHLDS